MTNQIKNIIRRVIFKKYPFLTDVSVEDRFKDLPNLNSMLGRSYVCYFKSDECLSEKEYMEIDTEVKNLFRMLSFDNFKNPEISCFFDCGKGYEFKMHKGYHH